MNDSTAKPRRRVPRKNKVKPVADRFWSKVDKSGHCWVWAASTGKYGYGNFEVGGKACLAHRVAWQLANGPIPRGLWVLHKCDNPPCVNPDHLFLGNHVDNMRDMTAKGRQVGLKGEKHNFAKLTRRDVEQIRNRYAAGGITQAQLAAESGVKIPCISRIITHARWK